MLSALLLSFATLATTHIAIAARLVLKARPRYRGLVVLLIPPLAPVYAYQQQWRKMCWLWVGAVVAYAITVAIAVA